MKSSMARKARNPVLVTGIGLVTSNGCGSTSLADQQRAMLLLNPTGREPTLPIGRINDFDKLALLGKKGLRHMSQATLFLLAAARMSLDMAGLDAEKTERQESIGMVAGTMTCNAALVADFDRTCLTEGPQMVDPGIFPETVWNSSSSHAAIRFGLTGMNTPVCSGMNSGLDAILFAEAQVQEQNEDIIIAGGYEELTPYFSVLFDNNGKNEPELPFGEGAAVLILEREATARARNITPLAKIHGGASLFIPSQAMANNKGHFLQEFIMQTLQDSGCDPSEVQLLWHLGFGEADRKTCVTSACEALQQHGFTPQVIDLTKHVGYCGGLAGGLAAALAVSSSEGSINKSVPDGHDDKSGHIELVISQDGHGRVAILIVEKNRS